MDEEKVSSEYSELYRKSFDTLKENLSFHLESAEFLSWYFFFQSNEDAIVHFYVKECPEWKFGIWWDDPRKEDMDATVVHGTLFAQFNDTIDKFKPSASTITAPVSVRFLQDGIYCDYYNALDVIEFIAHEPFLAFYRDYYSRDFNTMHVTRFCAFREYCKFKIHHWIETKCTTYFDKKFINFAKKYITPLYYDAFLIDHGDGWSPRYEVIAPFVENKDPCDIKEPGFYGIWDVDVCSKYDALDKWCRKVSKLFKFFWSPPVDKDVYFYGEEQNDAEEKEQHEP